MTKLLHACLSSGQLWCQYFEKISMPPRNQARKKEEFVANLRKQKDENRNTAIQKYSCYLSYKWSSILISDCKLCQQCTSFCKTLDTDILPCYSNGNDSSVIVQGLYLVFVHVIRRYITLCVNKLVQSKTFDIFQIEHVRIM